jgi:anti-sigma regulatory factor (Ser/Thr protein kinase)
MLSVTSRLPESLLDFGGGAVILAYVHVRLGGAAGSSREIKLDPDPLSVRTAREFVRRNLHELGFPGSVDDAVLITSELVTNAVREAPDTPCLLAIGIDGGRPVLEVHDGSPEGVELRPADFGSEHGRGLHVVDALCAEWDCVHTGGGKAVIVKLATGKGRERMTVQEEGGERLLATAAELQTMADLIAKYPAEAQLIIAALEDGLTLGPMQVSTLR